MKHIMTHTNLPNHILVFLQPTYMSHAIITLPNSYERDIISSSLGLAFSAHWKWWWYANITTLDLLRNITKWTRLAAQTNHNCTTIITITHDDWTNNPKNPLQQPHVTLILIIPPLTLQYTKTCIFSHTTTTKNPYSPTIWYSPIHPPHHKFPPFSNNSLQHYSRLAPPTPPHPHPIQIEHTSISLKHGTQPTPPPPPTNRNINPPPTLPICPILLYGWFIHTIGWRWKRQYCKSRSIQWTTTSWYCCLPTWTP